MDEKVALITGASSGIGRATALHLAVRGYRVHATMRTPQAAGPSLVEQARSEALPITVSQLDVTDPASVARAVSAVLADSGHIDVLINNAGIGDLGPVEMVSEDDTRRMFETNVFGPLRMLRAVLPGMRARHHGTIVNVSSVAGRIVGGGNGMYAATKHALEAASEALALEVCAVRYPRRNHRTGLLRDAYHRQSHQRSLRRRGVAVRTRRTADGWHLPGCKAPERRPADGRRGDRAGDHERRAAAADARRVRRRAVR